MHCLHSIDIISVQVMPVLKSKNVELLSLYGVLVNPKTGTRNDRDGTVTIQAFASLLQCFPLIRDTETFVDDIHSAVLSLCVSSIYLSISLSSSSLFLYDNLLACCYPLLLIELDW